MTLNKSNFRNILNMKNENNIENPQYSIRNECEKINENS